MTHVGQDSVRASLEIQRAAKHLAHLIAEGAKSYGIDTTVDVDTNRATVPFGGINIAVPIIRARTVINVTEALLEEEDQTHGGSDSTEEITTIEDSGVQEGDRDSGE